MLDQGFPLSWGEGLLSIETSQLIRQMGVAYRTDYTCLVSFPGSSIQLWLCCGEAVGIAKEVITSVNFKYLWPGWSLDGLIKQVDWAYALDTKGSFRLFFGLICRMCTLMSFLLCLCFNSSAFTADRHRKRKLMENSSLNSKLLKVNVSKIYSRSWDLMTVLL
jgi:hypothetical protein